MSTGPSARLSPGRVRARPFLRTARLNAVGYSALVGACLVAAVVSALALRATGWPQGLRAGVGPLVVVLALLGADRRKWARMETSFSFSDDARDLRSIADRLAAQNLPATVEVDGRVLVLRYRNGDAARVHAALDGLGIRAFWAG
jgi:hypothetical protein